MKIFTGDIWPKVAALVNIADIEKTTSHIEDKQNKVMYLVLQQMNTTR